MFKKDKLKQLRSITGDHCVSIYIPTEITGDYEINRIRWKNACQDALNQLKAKGVEKTSFLKPAVDLIDDPAFWAHQSAGLAGFYSEEEQSHHHLLSVSDSITAVDNKFHLSPVLKEVLNEDRVFVLALSQNEVRFFEAVPSGIFPVKIKDVVPGDMSEALNLDIDGNSLQTRSPGNSTIVHGNDSGDDKENVRLRQYFRSVDEGLLYFIHDEQVPLVLAGVEEYYNIYEEVTEYKYFSKHMVTGNPEDLSPQDLRSQIEPVFKELKEKRIQNFVESYNKGADKNLNIDDLPTIAAYADLGNVAQMLICQSYWDEMGKDQKIILDETMLSIYDKGGDIIVTEEQDHECETLHAIKRY